MIEVSSEQSRSRARYIYTHRVLLPLLLLLCIAILLLLPLQQQCCCFLLLLVIVCRIAKFGAGSLNLIPVFSFSSFKRDFIFDVPLGSTVSHLRSRFAYIHCNCVRAWSQGGRQPSAAKPPLYQVSYHSTVLLLSMFLLIDYKGGLATGRDGLMSALAPRMPAITENVGKSRP